MKGGKGGRPRKASVSSAARPTKGKKTGKPLRPANVAPPKGSRRKPHFGASSSSGEE